jgi:hypothetical protein
VHIAVVSKLWGVSPGKATPVRRLGSCDILEKQYNNKIELITIVKISGYFFFQFNVFMKSLSISLTDKKGHAVA